ncbi:hypothetical protein HKD37_18G049391 [Glycine soja]
MYGSTCECRSGAVISGAMLSNEIVHQKGGHNLWRERDSSLVVQSFKNSDLVPWKLKNRWSNCINLTKTMNFLVGHIFREDNTCADILANEAHSYNEFYWWNSLPQFLAVDFNRNRYGYTNDRFN